MDTSKQKPAKRAGKQYSPDIMYPYWSAAGGNVQEAMRKAKEAGEKRVPLKAHTWAAYVEKHDFPARLKKDEDDRWAKYHADRETRQQRVLDDIAFTFEQMADSFLGTLTVDLAMLRSGDEQAAGIAKKRLDKLFGSMDALDKFFRMYLRARGEPEKITKLDHSGSIPLTYSDLQPEGSAKAKTPEEARRLAEGGVKP